MTGVEHCKPGYWNKTWTRPYDNYKKHHAVFWNLINSEVPDGARVLDFGCGPCWMWKDRKIKLTGVDFSDEAIFEASKNFKRAKFYCSDIRLSNVTGDFDYIVLSGVINYIRHLELLLAELERIKGTVIITINQIDDFEDRHWDEKYIKETFERLGTITKCEFHDKIGWYIVITRD